MCEKFKSALSKALLGVASFAPFAAFANNGSGGTQQARIESADVYGNYILSGFTYFVGFCIFMVVLWGLKTFIMAMTKIPELRENSNDREAKQKIILSMIGGFGAIIAPVALVSGIYLMFGEGAITFQGSKDNKNMKALGVINQLQDSSQSQSTP